MNKRTYTLVMAFAALQFLVILVSGYTTGFMDFKMLLHLSYAVLAWLVGMFLTQRAMNARYKLQEELGLECLPYAVELSEILNLVLPLGVMCFGLVYGYQHVTSLVLTHQVDRPVMMYFLFSEVPSSVLLLILTVDFFRFVFWYLPTFAPGLTPEAAKEKL